MDDPRETQIPGNGNGRADTATLTMDDDDDVVARQDRPSFLSRLFRRFRGHPSDHVNEEPYTNGFGLNGITRKTDFGFNIDVTQLDKEATAQARSYAQANLPKIGVEYEDFPAETALSKKCEQVFRSWVHRVRTRIQDAIRHQLLQARTQLTRFENRLQQLHATVHETTTGRSELARLEESLKDKHATVGYTRFLRGIATWLLLLLLVGVDWVANVPVFYELLPREAGADEAWQEYLVRAERAGFWSGLLRVWYRVLHAPDVALLALGVIVFLVFLADVFGASLRRIVGISSRDVPNAASAIRGYRRQFYFPLGLSLLGGLIVIYFLFFARDMIGTQTDTRLVSARQELAVVEQRLAEAQQAGDADLMTQLSRERETARVIVAQAEERARYADTIVAMNVPILLLNIVLFLTAALIGYLAMHGNVMGKLDDPRVSVLRRKLDHLREDTSEHAREIEKIQAATLYSFESAEALIRSKPFEQWQAKAARLEAVLQTFRSENARWRGVDSANIAAFRRPVVLTLDPVDPQETFPEPRELAEYRTIFDELRGRYAKIQGQLQEQV